MFREFLEALGLTPAEVPPCPFDDKPEPTPQYDTEVTLDQGTKFYGGLKFVTDIEEDGTEVDVLVRDGDTRTSTCDMVDENQVTQHNKSSAKTKIKWERYVELKAYWAKNMSSKNVAKLYKGTRGYSESTLDVYWSVFNKVHTLRKKGGK